MKKNLLIVAVVGLALVAGYSMLSGGETRPVDDVVVAIESGATVIDVRRAGEYAGGHIAGAPNVDLFADDFEAQVAELPRDEPVYLYCASGVRSGRAARVMEGMGFETVVNAGGFSELAAAGAPVER